MAAFEETTPYLTEEEIHYLSLLKLIKTIDRYCMETGANLASKETGTSLASIKRDSSRVPLYTLIDELQKICIHENKNIIDSDYCKKNIPDYVNTVSSFKKYIESLIFLCDNETSKSSASKQKSILIWKYYQLEGRSLQEKAGLLGVGVDVIKEIEEKIKLDIELRSERDKYKESKRASSTKKLEENIRRNKEDIKTTLLQIYNGNIQRIIESSNKKKAKERKRQRTLQEIIDSQANKVPPPLPPSQNNPFGIGNILPPAPVKTLPAEPLPPPAPVKTLPPQSPVKPIPVKPIPVKPIPVKAAKSATVNTRTSRKTESQKRLNQSRQTIKNRLAQNSKTQSKRESVSITG